MIDHMTFYDRSDDENFGFWSLIRVVWSITYGNNLEIPAHVQAYEIGYNIHYGNNLYGIHQNGQLVNQVIAHKTFMSDHKAENQGSDRS
jgi:hypothetical protein